MNIFVGNLSFEAKEIDVQRAFMAFGLVTSVAIVKEKKGKKSRGFGFVEMPDEQEALAAIAQLQGQEILGRPINVMPSLAKQAKINRDKHPAMPVDNHRNYNFKRTGKYKQGRRSLSYVKQRLEAGITTALPEPKFKPNPMRWRKKPRWATPFKQPVNKAGAWQRPQTESNPWKKPKTKSGAVDKPRESRRPEHKTEARTGRPWEKTFSKPWLKGNAQRRAVGFKKRRKLS